MVCNLSISPGVSDLSLEAYQAAGSISPDYLMFLDIDFSQKDSTDDDQNTLLHYIVQTPCSRGQKEKAKTVIETVVNGGKGVLTKQNAKGLTPMMICLQKKQKCLPMFEILLDMAQSDDGQDFMGDSLVHHAARLLDDKDVELMKLILDKHGDFLDCPNFDGKTPFDMSKKYNTNSPKIQQLVMMV